MATTTTDRVRPSAPEIVLEELPHFPPALTHQPEDHDVAGGSAREHGKQGGFPDPGTGEQSEPLTLPTGREAVERPHAKIEWRSEPVALRGFGRGSP